MAILSLAAEALGRDLSPEEQELFAALSPQGVAKINRDLTRGLRLEGTLAELREVYRQAKLRRVEVESGFPSSSRELLDRMSRPATTEEMVLLSEKPSEELLCVVNERLSSGEAFDDILADLAEAHRLVRLAVDAQRLADAQGLAVSVSRLAPTSVPSRGDMLSPTAATFSCSKIRVGLSPLATWFEEQPSEVFDGLKGKANAAPAPGSPLKRSPVKVHPRQSPTSPAPVQATSSGPASQSGSPAGNTFDSGTPRSALRRSGPGARR
eukprot:RCo019843